VSGVVHVPLPPRDAFTLFTPTGERRWAAGWSPRFPAPALDETEPGTVFETEKAGRRTTWLVAACTPGAAITYARTTPDDCAGIVTIACTPNANGTTDACVGYDLTALTDAARVSLAAFAAQYPEFLEHWRLAIVACLAQE